MRGLATSATQHLPRRQLAVLAAVVISLLALTACGQQGQFATPGDSSSSHALTPPSIAVAGPGNGATGVSTAAEFPIQTNGKIDTVELVSDRGSKIGGNFERGDSTWIPEKQLAYNTKYTLKVKASKGRMDKSFSSDFTTMAKPGRYNGTTFSFVNGSEVGVGLPLVIQFDAAIPQDKRAGVEKRMWVTSNPQQEGSWNWVNSSEVHYRPKDYWKTGTKISARLAIGGVDMGNGYYGQTDRSINLTVGSSLISKVDNDSKKMQVFENGKKINEFPVSLGKPETPTSSGTMVLMDKAASMVFDSSTYGVPVNAPGGYRETVKWDVRYTFGGEFVHAAPWSVQQQGNTNTSHGCVNLSEDNAHWFYDKSKKGDIIQINGTEAKVKAGDSWDDWDLSWDEYQQGSALYQSPASQGPQSGGQSTGG